MGAVSKTITLSDIYNTYFVAIVQYFSTYIYAKVNEDMPITILLMTFLYRITFSS